MTIGTVESVTKSKSGKAWRVSIGGQWYGAKFDSNIEAAVGKAINFSFKSDEKYGDWIEGWAYSSSASETVKAVAAQATKANVNGDRFWLPFCSNQVAHAIQAGLIKEPSQISMWAKAAYEAIQAVDTL